MGQLRGRTPMRFLSALVVAASVGFVAYAGRSIGQEPPDPQEMRNGVNYTFERTLATRKVDDAYDRGQLSLVVYIWRPIMHSRHEVVLYSHGSLGGLTYDPREPMSPLPIPLLEFLLRDGYTVVVPTRRGFGASTGTYREECAFSAGKCSLAEYRALAEPGIGEAVRDTNAVIDQIIEGKEVPAHSKIIFSGVSRGGLLSLRMAAERPEVTKGVINFVGGWLSINEAWPAAENAARMDLQNRWFGAIGQRAHIPTLWIYAARDENYPEKVTRTFFAKFQETGGAGRFVFVTQHSLGSGHAVAKDPKLWEGEVREYLEGLR